jgi:hypothetical protein
MTNQQIIDRQATWAVTEEARRVRRVTTGRGKHPAHKPKGKK